MQATTGTAGIAVEDCALPAATPDEPEDNGELNCSDSVEDGIKDKRLYVALAASLRTVGIGVTDGEFLTGIGSSVTSMISPSEMSDMKKLQVTLD